MNHPGASMDAAEAREVLARGSKSFSFASIFLPASCRDDAAKVYAFCRAVDDLVDQRADDLSARNALRELEAALRAEAPVDHAVAAYLDVARRRGFGVEPALELIEGVRSDLGAVIIEDDDQLLRYCYRVAGTVGLMMSGVIGVRDRAASAFAIDLGVAMQLTNICRDVLEDARLGRVYLPRRRLEAQRVRPDQVLDGSVDRAAITAVTAELLALAERYYQSAEAGLRFIPPRPRFAIVLASRIYRAIGRKLIRRGGDPLRGRTVVSFAEKLGHLVFASLQFLYLSVSRWARRPGHDAHLHRPLLGLPGTNGTTEAGG